MWGYSDPSFPNAWMSDRGPIMIWAWNDRQKLGLFSDHIARESKS
jgi:hypothetical protein